MTHLPVTEPAFLPTSERLARALERARRQWQIRREAQEASVADRKLVALPLTIALSCEAGANGPEVARAIGEKLGWQVYDHELVDWIAQEMGVRADLLESIDEKRRSWVHEFVQSLILSQAVSESAYVRYLVETLMALAMHGECIIVGRGAAQVLPEKTTLRVRLVGPLQERIAAIQRHFSFSREEAAQWVEKKDRERRDFVRDHFFKDPAEPAGYDLLVNAFRYSTTQCADFIVTGLHALQQSASEKTNL